MAAGRYGGYRERGFRDRDSDLEAPRSKDHHYELWRRERDRSGLLDRVKARLGDVKEPPAANGSHRPSTMGSRNSRGGGGEEARFGRRSVVDREPGELSSGSGSDEPDEPVSSTKKSSSGKPENGVLLFPSKKRKFSPIVWDRDGGSGKKDSSSANASLGTRKEPHETCALPPPPPPPLPQGFIPMNLTVVVQRTAEPATSPYVEVSIDSPHEPGQVKIEEDEDVDFAPTRHISSSRWADLNDEDEAFDEETVPRRRKNIILCRPAEQQLQKMQQTPELGEVVAREGSEDATPISSGSSREQADNHHEMEVEKNDYMDIDGEDDNGGVSDLSDTEADVEHARPKIPQPVQPFHRCINMLHGCRSVDEFERLNKIDEGTYGVVYRAKDRKTGEIVALKKVKMEKEREGFPLTSLREINILLSFHHPSIVDVKEVVVGSSLDSIFMVMEYMEHDLKGLMETMKQPYSQSEVKCLMLQLFEGVKYLHDNWVLHRDLKTSNLLLNNRGELKICDFGLSRQYGTPLKPYTHLVVTLWYRSPELLLGAKEYSTAIDMWSLGCIMAELLAKEPLFNGKTEFDQLDKIFRTLGTPNEKIWPGFPKLPGVKVNFVKQPYNRLREKFPPTSFLGRPTLSEAGFDLLNKLLTYDPEKRITAEAALNHPWFCEVPLPKSKDFMPTFPAQHAQDRCLRRIMKSPDPLEEQRRKELQQGELGTGGIFG